MQIYYNIVILIVITIFIFIIQIINYSSSTASNRIYIIYIVDYVLRKPRFKNVY